MKFGNINGDHHLACWLLIVSTLSASLLIAFMAWYTHTDIGKITVERSERANTDPENSDEGSTLTADSITDSPGMTPEHTKSKRANTAPQNSDEDHFLPNNFSTPRKYDNARARCLRRMTPRSRKSNEKMVRDSIHLVSKFTPKEHLKIEHEFELDKGTEWINDQLYQAFQSYEDNISEFTHYLQSAYTIAKTTTGYPELQKALILYEYELADWQNSTTVKRDEKTRIENLRNVLNVLQKNRRLTWELAGNIYTQEPCLNQIHELIDEIKLSTPVSPDKYVTPEVLPDLNEALTLYAAHFPAKENSEINQSCLPEINQSCLPNDCDQNDSCILLLILNTLESHPDDEWRFGKTVYNHQVVLENIRGKIEAYRQKEPSVSRSLFGKDEDYQAALPPVFFR